jgi:hypothetical protein
VRELSLHPRGEHSDCVIAMWLCELAARDGAKRQAMLLPDNLVIGGYRSLAVEARAMDFVPRRRWGSGHWDP